MKKVSLLLCSGIVLLCQACSLTVPLDAPATSSRGYEQSGELVQRQMALRSALPTGHNASSGVVTVHLKLDGKALEAGSLFTESLQKELLARNLPIDFSGDSGVVVELKDLNILNHRSNGFSPWVTLSSAKVDLLDDTGGSTRLAAFVKRGKLPVWTMTEINEPCYNQPLELLVKEIAAKINKQLFSYSLPTTEVNAIANTIRENSGKDKLSYLDVYELGFSNNKEALPHLLEFATSKREYIRLAAISAIGILGNDEQIEFLKPIYNGADSWQDRGMALKAIGDIGSQKSKEFLQEQRERWAGESSKEARWNTLIIDLFLG
ncbi:HEAT repeat domain-containing protein [Porticoccus sp. W117]|uniref:HEAT repeat domain-containing protein n=1 Tax=Porticoccus sp. W117 TaxID=3054777 RepID=UPI0025988DDE|nr:HEAT repeat domain-containing protein [Porticoccus sp. W117]MDM3869842.1 HEAT repeat domain-containing protein [Porticoccus sp. W117]